jgi:hypothetical protein
MDGYFHFELESVAAAHISIYDRAWKKRRANWEEM